MDALTAALDAGVPLSVTDKDGNALLALACKAGQEAVVTALLERGADMDATNARGETALHACVCSPLHYFTKEDSWRHLDLLKTLIKAGGDPGRCTPGLLSPLMHAAWQLDSSGDRVAPHAEGQELRAWALAERGVAYTKQQAAYDAKVANALHVYWRQDFSFEWPPNDEELENPSAFAMSAY